MEGSEAVALQKFTLLLHIRRLVKFNQPSIMSMVIVIDINNGNVSIDLRVVIIPRYYIIVFKMLLLPGTDLIL